MREKKSRNSIPKAPRRKKKSAKLTPDRETAQLFDLVFKFLIQDASSVALVQLINGLFGKSFKLDTKVERVITEHVIKRRRKLVSIRSDCILEAEGESFMMEVQIGNDRTIALRLFEYGIAHAQKTALTSKDGSLIALTLPDAKVIYLEPTKQTPELITIRLTNPKGESLDYTSAPYKVTEELFKKVEERSLYLLLPFYLLPYRQEIKSPLKYGRSREELAREVAGLVKEEEEILERGLERGALTETDVVLVLERIEQMHTELYGTYKEFQEEQMRLQERLKSKVKAQEMRFESKAKAQEIQFESKVKAQEMQFESKAKAQEMQFESKMKAAIKQTAEQTAEQTENKILGLFKQGYSLEEVEKLLAQEAGTQTGTTVFR
ncbi:hypothetical protein ACYULU_05445 [Breznakiellaceae bacterium SP9]